MWHHNNCTLEVCVKDQGVEERSSSEAFGDFPREVPSEHNVEQRFAKWKREGRAFASKCSGPG